MATENRRPYLSPLRRNRRRLPCCPALFAPTFQTRGLQVRSPAPAGTAVFPGMFTPTPEQHELACDKIVIHFILVLPLPARSFTGPCRPPLNQPACAGDISVAGWLKVENGGRMGRHNQNASRQPRLTNNSGCHRAHSIIKPGSPSAGRQTAFEHCGRVRPAHFHAFCV